MSVLSLLKNTVKIAIKVKVHKREVKTWKDETIKKEITLASELKGKTWCLKVKEQSQIHFQHSHWVILVTLQGLSCSTMSLKNYVHMFLYIHSHFLMIIFNKLLDHIKWFTPSFSPLWLRTKLRALGFSFVHNYH